MKWALWLLIGVAFLAGWVRLAPSSPENWHIDPNAVDAPGIRATWPTQPLATTRRWCCKN